MKTLPCGVAAAIVIGLAVGSMLADEPAGRVGHVMGRDGGKLPGSLVAAPEAEGSGRDTIVWRSPKFTEPFEFRLADIAGVFYEGAAAQPAPAPSFVRLRGGDVLPATVASLDDESLVIDTPGVDAPQRLRIARTEVAGISRNAAGGGSYAGPSGLEGWEQTPPGAWREEARRLVSSSVGAALTRNVNAPSRACYRVRLARRAAAEFRVAIAAAEKADDDGYAVQAIGSDASQELILVRRGGGKAVIEPLPRATWRNDLLELVIFVDQETGRMAVIVPGAEGDAGRRATEATLAPEAGTPRSGRFRLEVGAGEVGLDRLEVTAWRGAEPTLGVGQDTAIATRAGSLEGFSVTSYDPAAAAYVLARGGETKRVAAADVEEIRFPNAGGDVEPPPAVRVLRADETTVSGDLVKTDDRAVWVRRRGVEPVVAVPLETVVAIRGQAGRPLDEQPGRAGTLVIGGERMRGRLADGPGGLAWRPVGSVNAVPFAAPVDAEVEYVPRSTGRNRNDSGVGGIGGLVTRDVQGLWVVAMMTEDGAAARDGRLQPTDRIVAIAPREKSRFVETKDLDNETVTHLLRGRIGTVVRLKVTDAAGANPREIALARGPINVAGRDLLDQALQVHARLGGVEEAPDDNPYPALVVLQSGDSVPCRIESIADGAILLESPLSGGGAVRVPDSLVKAVELMPAAASRAIDRLHRQRLLTLPRMQRDRPPTHLIRLVDGDYLRGRLVKVDAATVTLEVLDVVKQFPRRQVVRVIWLHPDVPRPDGDEAPPPEPEPEGIVVQGVGPDGRRMTLVADRVEGDVLRGRSRALGDATIDLARMDRVLLGAAVGRDAPERPYFQWTLKPAPEPRALGKPDGE